MTANSFNLTQNREMFTGNTQDIVAGITDTPNRELGPIMGRWLSPDPANAGWNLYGYSPNPLSNPDPSGLDGEGEGEGGPDVVASLVFVGGGIRFRQIATGFAPDPGNIYTEPWLLTYQTSGAESMPLSMA